MVNKKDIVLEITIEKGKEAEIRCGNCGKKLLVLEKNCNFSSKNAGIVLKTKCSRCYKFNQIGVK